MVIVTKECCTVVRASFQYDHTLISTRLTIEHSKYNPEASVEYFCVFVLYIPVSVLCLLLTGGSASCIK